jgi:acetyl-CoA synthetase
VTPPSVRVEELLAEYGAADACLARLLYDDYPAEQIAFTVGEADLTTHDVS